MWVGGDVWPGDSTRGGRGGGSREWKWVGRGQGKLQGGARQKEERRSVRCCCSLWPCPRLMKQHHDACLAGGSAQRTSTRGGSRALTAWPSPCPWSSYTTGPPRCTRPRPRSRSTEKCGSSCTARTAKPARRCSSRCARRIRTRRLEGQRSSLVAVLAASSGRLLSRPGWPEQCCTW